MRTMFELSPEIFKHLKRGEKSMRAYDFALDNGSITFGWAGSPSTLASDPIRYVFLDESSKYMLGGVHGESDAVSLAKERIKTFGWRAKVVVTSTPIHATDLIMREYEEGDQRHYHVPCPHCGVIQQFVLDGLKCPDEMDGKSVREHRAAWYECEGCKGKILDQHKPKMLKYGEWIADVDRGVETPNHVSYQINSMYSPFLSFSDVLAEYMEATTREKLQNFMNGWMATPFQEQVVSVKKTALQPLIDSAIFRRGVVPKEAQLITIGVDWHGSKKGLYYSVYAWGSDYRVWLIDIGQVFTLADLDLAIYSKKFITQDGRTLSQVVGVDAQYETQKVYMYCQKKYPHARPTQGVIDLPGPYQTTPVEPTKKEDGSLTRWKMSRLRINNEFFKDVIAQMIDPEYEDVNENPDEYILRVFLNDPEQDAGLTLDTWAAHMTAEHKVVENNKEVWLPKYSKIPNHLFDTAVIAYAVADLFGVRSLRPLQNTHASEEAQPANKTSGRKPAVRVMQGQVHGRGEHRRH